MMLTAEVEALLDSGQLEEGSLAYRLAVWGLEQAGVRTSRAPHNRWLSGEQQHPGIYADDNGEGHFLRCYSDEQGDVYFSVQPYPGPCFTAPSVRMVSHCTRRPHVITAARRLAEALQQGTEQERGER